MRAPFLLTALLFAGAVQAQNCSIDLKADDQMKFDQTSITVSAACEAITINLTHTGKLPVETMGHNVVIAATENIQAVSTAGIGAGVAGSYVPANDPRVIAHTSVVGGGASTSATFPGKALTAGGTYSFFCSFPGHWAIMKGTLVVQ